MFIYQSKHNYDVKPDIRISDRDEEVLVGNNKLQELILNQIKQGNKIFVFDIYPGVNKDNLLSLLKKIKTGLFLDTDNCKFSEEELYRRFDRNITEDRVFGYMTRDRLEDCFDPAKVSEVKAEIEESQGKIIFLTGVGASLFARGDIHYYADITRWEIQLRYRTGTPNWLFCNPEAPVLTKYKIGFFLEWRLADTHKEENFDKVDYWIDANVSKELKVIDRNSFYKAYSRISGEPFRMEPYFDKSVWGGQWMKETFELEPEADNYGWAFDGVPEENSVRFCFGKNSVTFPTMNLVKLYPAELLGSRVYEAFGAEFPIRFDMLDTFGGGNLSLQVHPTLDYIRNAFGMSYTQDESYYILDAAEDSCVYIGLREGIDREAMLADLKAANRGELIFDAEKYINRIPVKKHDHILIPAGTVHCSGKDTQVLEISATPYIFTFKLWDWGHIGLDGLPRPVHIDHGSKNIQWNRDTKWVMSNLIHQEEVLSDNGQCIIERTGLHEYEFIETLRYTFSGEAEISLKGSAAVLNLVEGRECWLKSKKGSWPPKKIHYCETFIIPAGAEEFVLEALEGEEIKVIVATVR